MALRRLIYAAVLGAALVFFTAYQEWFSWFALLLILGLPWLSLLLSLPAMLTFHVDMLGPGTVAMGVPTEVRLLGWCRLPVPPFRGKLRLTRITTGEQWLQKTGMDLPTDHCGGLSAEGERVWVYDYLGLFRIRVRKVGARTLIVRPKPMKIPGLPDQDKFLPRRWRPKVGGGFAENHELRLYRPGDSLNQVHWKLTAKTGKLILREPMEPERGLMLITMNLRGTAQELDRKFGRLAWLGQHLLEKNMHYEIRALTAEGIRTFPITGEGELTRAVDELLCAAPAAEGDLREMQWRASWHYHIGGEPDET